MVEKGKVYLIGAGPGDRGLITVKGLACLQKADVVLYDKLSNPDFLLEAPEGAELVFVGKVKGNHHLPQPEINALLVEKALEGKTVVRLKGGDPYIFGRGGEEAQVLFEAGVSFEVIPGVTAGFAAAAYAGIPLTHRDFTTSLGLVTGHEKPGKKVSDIDWERLATGVGTLVFYMGLTNVALIAERLMAHGRSATTPVAIISRATTPRQQTLVGTLADVAEKAGEAQIPSPAVIVVGEVVNLRRELRWFDDRPLFGRRILVTRTTRRHGRLASFVEEEGGEAVSCTVVEKGPPASWEDLDDAVVRLPEIDYLVLTSPAAVEALWSRLRATRKDARALSGVFLAVSGGQTAEALEKLGIYPDLQPDRSRAEGLVELLRERGLAGKGVLFPRGNGEGEMIAEELTAAGALVCAPVAYNVVANSREGGRIRRMLEDGELDAVALPSSAAVEGLVELLGSDAGRLLQKVKVVSIGTLTTSCVRRLGGVVDIEASGPSPEEMATAMVDYFADAEERGEDELIIDYLEAAVA